MKKLGFLMLIAFVVLPRSYAQDASKTNSRTSSAGANSQEQQGANDGNPAPALENTVDAGESQEEPRRQLVHWNEYRGPYFTVRFGGGFLYDTVAFAQDEQSKKQFRLDPDDKIRDFRFLLKGSFPSFKRSVTWSAGIMYDAPTHSWLWRQTGIMVEFPELWGNLFIGRAKEGFSLNKVMVGYAGWTSERATFSDATIPILGDGFKWLGYTPKHSFFGNLGYFNDLLSKGQSFSSYSSQGVARLIWLPIHTEESPSTLFHLGLNLRYGKPVDNKLRLRSRPEARRGAWLFGSEYWWVNVKSATTGNPQFNGGDLVATWLITGETRTYNTVEGFFRAVSPAKPVFSGGPGAWEMVLRLSNSDLDSNSIRGGKFWRFTPMVNWHMSDNVRVELTYGYGRLSRFDLKGNTQFFQTRVQLQL